MARSFSANVLAGLNGGSSPVWLLEVDSETTTFRWATASCNVTAVPTWSGNNFDGSRLEQDGLGDVTTKADLSKGGNRAELSGFTFKLLNGDLYSDTLASEQFSGRRVELRLIFIDKTSPSWTNGGKIWKGYITEPPTWDERFIYFTCSPSWVSRHKTLPPRVLTSAEFPDLISDNEGRRIPIVLGDWRLGLGQNRSGIASNRSPGASEVIHRDYFTGILDRPFQRTGNNATYNPRAMFADHYLKNFPVPLQEGSKFVWNEARKIWTRAYVHGATFGGIGDFFNGITALGCFASSLDILTTIHFVPIVDDINSANVSNLSYAVDEDDSNYTELNGASDVASYEIPAIFGSGSNASAAGLYFWIDRSGFVDDKVQFRINGGAWTDVPTYGALYGPAATYTSTGEGTFGGVRVEFKYTQVGGFDGASFKIYSVYWGITETNGGTRGELFETGSGLIYERWIDSATHTTAKSAGDLIENPAAAIEALLAHYCDINPEDTNGALVFDGADYLALRSNESLEAIPGAFTIAAWVYITESPISTPHSILRKCDSVAGPTAAPYDFYISAAAKLTLYVGNGAAEAGLIGATSLSPNTWYFVAATWDGTTGTVYLNGASDGSSVLGLTAADAGIEGAIGGNGNLANSGLTGRLDELQVWNYARSSATLAAEYTSKTYHAQGEEGLILLCHFDEGAGNHFRDASGMNNDPLHTGSTTTPSSWATGTIETPGGVNVSAFDDLHSNKSAWKLATILSVIEDSKLSLDIIKDICNEFALAYLQDGAGLEKVARIEALGNPAAITGTHILTEGKNSSARVTRGKITDVRNEFYFHYNRNASSKQYDSLLFCTNPSAGAFKGTFCNFATDAETYWTKCRDAYKETKQVLKWEFFSNFIRDRDTAELACKAFVSWLTKLPYFFSFTNSLSLLELELFDNKKITHALLPAQFDPLTVGSEQFRLVEQTIQPSRNRQKLVFRSVGNETLTPPSLSLPGVGAPSLDLNADSITKLADGDPLALWENDSGAGEFSGSGGTEPKFRSSLGPKGGACIIFDGSTQYMDCAGTIKLADIVAAGAFTIFAVLKVSAIATSAVAPFSNDTLLGESVGSKFALAFRDGTPDALLAVYDGATQEIASKPNLGDWDLLEFVHNGSDIFSQINEGGFVSKSAGSITDLTGDLILGRDQTGAFYFNGSLARLVVYNSKLSDEDARLVRESLNTLYGIY